LRRRLFTRELVDDHVAYEIPQRQGPPVMSVRCKQMRTAQTGDGQRVQNLVIRLRVEEMTRRIEVPLSARQVGNVEERIRGAIDVTGPTTDARLPRSTP